MAPTGWAWAPIPLCLTSPWLGFSEEAGALAGPSEAEAGTEAAPLPVCLSDSGSQGCSLPLSFNSLSLSPSFSPFLQVHQLNMARHRCKVSTASHTNQQRPLASGLGPNSQREAEWPSGARCQGVTQNRHGRRTTLRPHGAQEPRPRTSTNPQGAPVCPSIQFNKKCPA